ncbi:ComF family protein [Companilactobacillus nodensis]|uniref:COMF operon protein 3 n=1 Tax=Companilactobacillus nodensis DSM 19682 = JCM 14932 = NBRC 107160 TaxID=1423775 RepID=A0A0R1K7A6_9LACO|nr:phosphoribosyltransferase family protein [Companilactobacillus nodensis]KRK79344.1 COMF operon protein 3 [Companilactobacillus nodensis DSM 19682 = JCM 14932 = NBRC 107160]
MKCLFCGNLIVNEWKLKELFGFEKIVRDNICQLCRNQLELLNPNEGCIRCYKRNNESICQDCRFWEEKYQIINCHQSLFEYNQFIHSYFKNYKRYGDILLAELFSKDLYNWSKCNRFDIITYIPASNGHLQERGFDPVWKMYHQIFDLTPMLVKLDADKPQAQKNRYERLQTPQTFYFQPSNLDISRNSKVLILDDIYTTGRTMMHARQALEIAGFNNICTFSLSR